MTLVLKTLHFLSFAVISSTHINPHYKINVINIAQNQEAFSIDSRAQSY